MTYQRVEIHDSTGGLVIFTATVKEVGKFQVAVAEHPVERGANVLDHARPQLAQLTLEGIVSDVGLGDADTAQAALTYLLGLYKSPRVVEIVTGRVLYEAMLMTSLEVPKKREDGKAQRFVCEFKEYRTARTKLTRVSVKLGKKQKRGPQEPGLVFPEPLQSKAHKAGVSKMLGVAQ